MSKKIQKVISVTTSVATIAWLSGIAALVPMAAMATTINEGDTIRVANTYDIYIAKYVGSKKFKRLILNPEVFNSYGHLSWSAVKTVTQAEMDSFTNSDLVRALGDTKVYKLVPNGDVGSKQWMNMTAEAFTAGGWDWDSIYVINNVDRDNYTTGADITSGTSTSPSTSASAGSVSVALASDTPAAGIAVEGAARVPFTKVTMTTGSEAATINSLTVQRAGLADDLGFASLVLVDQDGNQVGLSQTLNSAHQVIFNEAFTIPANTTRTYTLSGNMAASLDSYAGQVASLSLVAVSAAGTVSGSFPMTGNGQTLNATLTIGTATITAGSLDPGSAFTKNVGTTAYNFSALKITGGSAEDVTVYSIRWNQSGSAATSDLANVKVSDGTTDYATTVSSDGKYYTVNFGTGISIGKGLNKEFTIKGDIINGSARTVSFDIYRTTDIVVKGNVYGYYMTPTFTDNGATHATANATDISATTSPYFQGAHVTIGGGSLRIDKSASGAPSANITRGATGQILGAFDFVVQGESVNVASIRLDFDHTGTGSTSDITSITLNKADGTVLSTGGTAADDTTAHAATLDGTLDGHVTFSGTITFPVGTTQVIVKGNLNTDFAANDTFRTGMNTPDVRATSITGATTGNTITATPAAAVWGNSMTVKGGALTVNVSATPVAQPVIAGTQGFTFANYLFDATTSGEDIRVTLMTLRYQHTNLLGADLNTMFLYDGATKLNTTAVDPVAGDGDQEVTFTLDVPLIITKGTQKTVTLKGNVLATATLTNSATWGMTASAALTATGVSTGNNIDESTPGGGGQAMSIDASGQYSVALDASTPSSKLVAANTTGNVITTLRFKATAEQITVDKVTLALYTASSTTRDMTNVSLYNDATLLGSGFLGVGNATGLTSENATTTYTLSTPLVIPANEEKIVTVKADIAPITQDSTIATAGDRIIIAYYNTNSETTNGGDAASGVRVAGFSTTATHIPGNSTYIFKSVPTVSAVTLTNSLTSGNGVPLFKFKVAADAKGDIDLFKVTFRISTSSVAAMYVLNPTLVDVTNADETVQNDATTIVSGTTDLNMVLELSDVANTPRTIAAGSFRTFELRGDVSGSVTTGSSVSTMLMGDAFYEQPNGTEMQAAATVDAWTTHDDFIWSDRSATGHGVGTADWTNGYLVSGLPSTNMSTVTISY
ncbi:MAG: hypothetical protein UU87_C0002G0123 [Parcubacteria group bacterium GW2011_GWA2_42_11]|nr:MAG: hypothetical protein UU87_C0002G0123 [Parcubacteria group bacterium GW2011_GWA2_42_11]